MKLSNVSVKVTAVILCAGTGSRTNLSYNKILHYAGNKTLVETALDSFFEAGVDNAVIVINKKDETAINEIAALYDNVTTVYGGDTRAQSVRCGLKAAIGCDIVAIHDGARPFTTPNLIVKTVDSAIKHGSGIAAVPATDTIKESQDGKTVARGLCRDKLWCMQTPQTFNYNKICAAYENCNDNYTDDCEVWQQAGLTPVMVLGEYENIKVTTAADLLRSSPTRTKIGIGFDVHELVPNRPLILGGVNIEYTKGLIGHSDADVLTHAIIDALLSAAELPDIGTLFPDSDTSTENISSLILLDSVKLEIEKRGFHIGNISAAIMAQKPKLAPYIGNMRNSLALRLGTDIKRINISATTTERLGIIGEEKGIAASATCLLYY